jgi:hypothetical protein
MTNELTFVVFCETLGLQTPFARSCWGHVMSKCTQYVTNDAKVSTKLTFVFIKETKSILQKTITWTKKSGNGQQEW